MTPPPRVERESVESHLRHALQLLEFYRHISAGGDVEGVNVYTPAELLEQTRVRITLALVEVTKGEVV